MAYAQILALATLYCNRSLRKEATLLDNMAARILWSTIPAEQQLNNINALKSLTYGAKELIRLGAKATMEELSHTDKDSYTKAFIEIENKNYEAALKISLESFKTVNQAGKMYGGRAWVNIAQNLLLLLGALNKAEQYKNAADYNNYVAELNNVVVYMNVIDGLAHNTGSIMDKMLNIEFQELKTKLNNSDKEYDENELYKKFWAYKDDIIKLMDAKELTNKEDVFDYTVNKLQNIPEKLLPFKDFIKQRQYERAYEEKIESDPEQEFKIIRIRKELLEYTNSIKAYYNNLKAETTPEGQLNELDEIKFALSSLIRHLKNNDINEIGNTSQKELQEFYDDLYWFLSVGYKRWRQEDNSSILADTRLNQFVNKEIPELIMKLNSI